MIQNKNIDNTIIDFVVDTGSTLTIISVKDARKRNYYPLTRNLLN